MEAKIAQMDLLIEQVLETARFEHNRFELHLERFDLSEVLEEQVNTFRPLSQGHHFVVQCFGRVRVNGDRSRLGTIIGNLLDNALKYSPDGGEICWTVGIRGSRAFVSVRDNRIGIAQEHMSRLFTRFGRLPTEENVSTPGTALGLFLSRQIAIRHGGDIDAESQSGQGSEFILTLPAIL